MRRTALLFEFIIIVTILIAAVYAEPIIRLFAEFPRITQ